MKAEEEDKISEESRLKLEEHKRAWMKVEERQEAKENEHAQLKVEEWVRLALEARRRAEEDNLGLKAE